MSVRGGGHGVAGTAVCEDALMIDLSPMKVIAVDPVRREAVAGPAFYGASSIAPLRPTDWRPRAARSRTQESRADTWRGPRLSDGEARELCVTTSSRLDLVTAEGERVTATKNSTLIFSGLYGVPGRTSA